MAYKAMNYLGNVSAATRAKAEEVLGALEAARGKQLTHTWGIGSSSEHATGRAVDFMVFDDRAAGDFIADYIWDNRERLNLIHIIWYQRIKSTQVEPGKWRKMGNRGSRTENHMDHPHVLFGTGPYVPPAAGSKLQAGPLKPVEVTGELDVPTVQALQRALNGWRRPGMAAIGEDGLIEEPSETIRQLQWQISAGQDGYFGPESARKLETWLGVAPTKVPGWYPGLVRALQRRLNAEIEAKTVK